jgi:Domain of unknown function (DUF4169)
MGKVVNLRTARKQQARAAARAEAAEGAAKSGESKPAKRKRQAEAELALRRFEGHRCDDPEA